MNCCHEAQLSVSPKGKTFDLNASKRVNMVVRFFGSTAMHNL